MATRRRRRRSRSIGDSFQAGRDVQFASRRSSLLPRTLPAGIFLRPAASPLAASIRSPLTARYVQRKETAQERRSRVRRAERFYGALLRRAVMPARSVCSRRDRRRQVLHASGVAGVRGGAWRSMMRNARFNNSSYFTCRR